MVSRLTYKVLFFVVLACCNNLARGQCSYHGKLQTLIGKACPSFIYLCSYTAGDKIVIDSSDVDEDGRYYFVLKNTVPGLGELKIPSWGGIPIVLDSCSKVIDLGTVTPQQAEQYSVPEVFLQLRQLQNAYLGMLQEHQQLLNRMNSDSSIGKDKMQWFVRHYYAMRMELNHRLSEIEDKSNGYVKNVLIPFLYLRPIGNTDTLSGKWFQQHYFDNWPLQDATLFNNPLLRNAVNVYASLWGQVNGSFDRGSDVLFAREMDPSVQDYLLGLWAGIILKAGKDVDKSLAYLESKDDVFCSEGALPDRRFNLVIKLKPGQQFPELSLPDTAGVVQCTTTIQKAGKATLVLFWNTGCPHCEELMSVITKFMKEHTKDVTVFAVATDTDPGRWKEYVRHNNMPGRIDVCDFKGVESPALKSVFIFGTPLVYMINSKGRITGERIRTEKELEQSIQSAITQQ